jgi:hypothetical protein
MSRKNGAPPNPPPRGRKTLSRPAFQSRLNNFKNNFGVRRQKKLRLRFRCLEFRLQAASRVNAELRTTPWP